MWYSRGIRLILWALVRFFHCLLELIPEHIWEQISLQITHRPKRVTELNPCPPTVGDVFKFTCVTLFWVSLDLG